MADKNNSFTQEDLKALFNNKSGSEVQEISQEKNSGNATKSKPSESSGATATKESMQAKEDEVEKDEVEKEDEDMVRVVNFKKLSKEFTQTIENCEKAGLSEEAINSALSLQRIMALELANGGLSEATKQQSIDTIRKLEAAALLKSSTEVRKKDDDLTKEFSLDNTFSLKKTLSENLCSSMFINGKIDKEKYYTSTLGRYTNSILQEMNMSGLGSIVSELSSGSQDRLVIALPISIHSTVEQEYRAYKGDSRFNFAQSNTQDGANAGTLKQETQLLQEYYRNIQFLDQIGVVKSNSNNSQQITLVTQGQTPGSPVEGATNTDTSLTFSKLSVTPYASQVSNSITQDLLAAGGAGTNYFTDILFEVLRDSLPALEENVNNQFINGTGTNGTPIGLLTLANTITYPLTANPTYQDILNVEAGQYAAKSMYRGNKPFCWLSNQNFGKVLKGALKFSNSGSGFNTPIIASENGNYMINTYPYVQTDLIPTTLGASTNQSAVFFGDFGRCVVTQFMNVFVVVDYATLATQRKIAINLFKYYGFGFRRPASITKSLFAIA